LRRTSFAERGVRAEEAGTQRLGRIHLAPGFTRANAYAYLYAAFFSICLLAFLSFIQPYTLNVNLGIPENMQGRATLTLGALNEIITLLLIGPFGALSDKVGRRVVYALGFLWIGAGFAVIPFSSTFTELVLATMFWSVGAAAVGAMLSTVLADTPQERSRGALVGLTGICQGFGILLGIFVLSRLPRFFAAGGMDPIVAGRLTYATATVLCVITALVCLLGLRRAPPAAVAEHETLRHLLRAGVAAAAHNPRIVLAYCANFIARADLAIIGTYFSLRLTQAGIESHMSGPEAIANAGRVYGMAQLAALLTAVAFLFFADRLNRVTVVILAMVLAAIGYTWVGLTDPLSPVIYAAAVMMGVGELCAILAAQLLLGQEAPLHLRGSVIGLAGIFGSLGTLFANLFGGWLYDVADRSAPFLLIGACNVVILAFALRVRARHPAPAT
jgi:MFS family permease